MQKIDIGIAKIILKSFSVSVLVIAAMYVLKIYLNTSSFISDTGGISAFASVYGTLYGIAVALVLLEVLSQFNKTSGLIGKEALGLERLFRLTLYFRDKPFTEKVKKAIKKYIDLIVKDDFKTLASGEREKESSKAFREIANIIRDVKFDDDHDAVVFHHIIQQYGDLSETRTERIEYSLMRLPAALKAFLYSSSFLTIFIFILMPFVNIYYGFITTGTLAFVISMAFRVIEDLDNPFEGFWTITTEPFKRAWKHIEEDY